MLLLLLLSLLVRAVRPSSKVRGIDRRRCCECEMQLCRARQHLLMASLSATHHSSGIRMRRLLAFALCALLTAAHAHAQTQAQAEAPTRHIFGAMVPMRDGVRLAADIWLPKTPGRYPVLIARTP